MFKGPCNRCASQELELILDKSDIAKENFDVIITGDDLEEGKPDPAPFQVGIAKIRYREAFRSNNS